MKICWDNLEGVFLTRSGKLAKKNNSYFYCDACKKCGEPYLATAQSIRKGNGKYCCMSCYLLENNPAKQKEVKEKISKSCIGKLPWNKGKIGIYSDETLEKMSIASKGKTGNKNSNWRHGLSYTNGYFCAHSARRRAQKRVGKESLTTKQKLEIDEYYQIRNLLGPEWEVDHIIPLSKGGLHHPDNLQIIPKIENRKKYNKRNYEVKSNHYSLGERK